MHKQGEMTDSSVLGEVTQKPGVAVSEIAEALNWSNGKVDGSLNRLIAQKKITVKHLLKKGVLVKRIYPQKYVEKSKNIIELPLKNTNPKLWQKSGYVYALSRSTIGFAPKEIEEWNEKALFRDCINFKKNNKQIEFVIPKQLETFYQLTNSDISLSSLGGIALVTVESVLPVDLPPAHPEELPIARFSFTARRERFEGSSAGFNFVYVKEGFTKKLTVFSKQHYFSIKDEENIETFTESTDSSCNKVIDIKAEV